MFNDIITMADGMKDELVSIRRDFHRYPEIAWLEIRTGSLIARRLSDMGYEVHAGPEVCGRGQRACLPTPETFEENYRRALSQGADPEYAAVMKDGSTGVVAELKCGEGPVVALRFDIDCLPITESAEPSHLPAREGFISRNPGWMHACGHDGHATIGLGAAKILMALKDRLHGTVRLLFQPDEESGRGAKAMIDGGWLDGVDYILGAHVSRAGSVIAPPKDLPECFVIAGSGHCLAITEYEVHYRGQSAHSGACPERGRNALLAAAVAVQNLYAITRNSAAGTRVNVGVLRAGSARNAIADSADFTVEVRGDTDETWKFMEEHAKHIVKSAAEMYGCECEIVFVSGEGCIENTPELSKRVARVCTEELGITAFSAEYKSGSEDYSNMSNYVMERGGQSCFFRNVIPCAGEAHSPSFNIDERALTNGAKAFAGVVYDILK